MKGSYELSQLREKISSLSKEINTKFDDLDYVIPDTLPANWGRDKLKINISLDYLNGSHRKIFENVFDTINKRNKLRKKEAKMMLSLELIKIQETSAE